MEPEAITAGLLPTVDDTIASLMRGISRNGSDIKDILRLEVGSRLSKSRFTQSDIEYVMREDAYNVLMACRRAARHEGMCIWENGNEKVWSPIPYAESRPTDF